MVSWKRLIRFEDANGTIHHGEPIVEDGQDVGAIFESGNLEAYPIEGNDIYGDCRVTSERVAVEKLLGPLGQEEVPIIRCVGLNYMLHIKEAGRKPPPYPSIFFKPNTCIADYGEAIPIPKLAQDEQCDYEGELVCPRFPRFPPPLKQPLISWTDDCDREDGKEHPARQGFRACGWLRRSRRCLRPKMATRSRLRRRRPAMVLLQGLRPICPPRSRHHLTTNDRRCGQIATADTRERASSPRYEYR
jgi:Fumarylacetoacetate (FAA) hydrolase family